MQLAQITTPRGGVELCARCELDLDYWVKTRHGDEAYCLDAPSHIPAGSTIGINDNVYACKYVVRGR